MEIIFKILCGILYAIGCLFGLTYEEISIDICIYACPVICCLFAAIGLLLCSNKTWFTRMLKATNLALLLFYIENTKMFWNHYSVLDPFQLCVDDLNKIAANLNLTYEEVNIQIYCYLFFGILLFHVLTIIISKYIIKKKKQTT